MKTNNGLTESNTDNIVLSGLESKILVAVVKRAIREFCPGVTYGTFILDVQRWNHKAENVLRFDLPWGCLFKDPLEGEVTNFSVSAKSAIDLFLCDEAYDEVSTGIYAFGESKVLVANTSSERFLASFYGNFPPNEGGIEWKEEKKLWSGADSVLAVVAETLMHLRPHDSRLSNEERRALFQYGAPFEIRSFIRGALRAEGWNAHYSSDA